MDHAPCRFLWRPTAHDASPCHSGGNIFAANRYKPGANRRLSYCEAVSIPIFDNLGNYHVWVPTIGRAARRATRHSMLHRLLRAKQIARSCNCGTAKLDRGLADNLSRWQTTAARDEGGGSCRRKHVIAVRGSLGGEELIDQSLGGASVGGYRQSISPDYCSSDDAQSPPVIRHRYATRPSLAPSFKVSMSL